MSPPCAGCFQVIRLTRLRRKARKINILIVGIDGAGKTSLLLRLKGDPSNATKTSWGFTTAAVKFKVPLDRTKERGIRRQKTLVTLNDIGGDTKIREIWKNYFAEAHGCIYVVDSTCPQRAEEAKAALAEVYQDPRMEGKPLLLLANKQDAEGAQTPDELVAMLNLESIGSTRLPIVKDSSEGWWVSVQPAVTKATTTLKDGESYARDVQVFGLLRAVLDRYSALDTRCRRDMDVQQKQWDQDRKEQRRRTEELRHEHDKLEKALVRKPNAEVLNTKVMQHDEADDSAASTGETLLRAKGTGYDGNADTPQTPPSVVASSAVAAKDDTESPQRKAKSRTGSRNRIYPEISSTEISVSASTEAKQQPMGKGNQPASIRSIDRPTAKPVQDAIRSGAPGSTEVRSNSTGFLPSPGSSAGFVPGLAGSAHGTPRMRPRLAPLSPHVGTASNQSLRS
ncbi:ADP-ribosylation factor family-domain-containing protein [Phlyctochytrium arcticum]|nr:ADP-ribosylation factor family-domain-containing protein [Phlyctochytrium arcticum]